jgi:16S rRNA (guanine527-N7)-methyltransferase
VGIFSFKRQSSIYNQTRMQSARIAELLEPFLGAKNDNQLTSRDLDCISTYIDILLRWNARINLTAVRDPEEIVSRHFGESLFTARSLFPSREHVGTAASGCPAEHSSAATVADLGSGAGFPGLPIKLWAPYISLTLIESNHKKTTFLHEIVRALTLTDINIQNARAESITGMPYDLVTLRAVERFETILPVAAHLVAPAGRIALLIGSSQLDRARLALPGLSWSNPEPIPASNSRVLVVAQRLN